MTAIGKEDLFGYAAKLTRIAPEDGGGWLAEVPELPGCLSDGETPEDALANVREAIECWLAAALEDGDTPPVPRAYEVAEYSGKFTLRVPRSLHRALSEAAQREGVSLNQLVLSMVSAAIGADLIRPNPAPGRAVPLRYSPAKRHRARVLDREP
jgi:antitoxin HicB